MGSIPMTVIRDCCGPDGSVTEMSDLKCKNCGIEASYADANIADRRRTCGSDGRPSEVEASDGSVKYAYGGRRHEWIEQ